MSEEAESFNQPLLQALSQSLSPDDKSSGELAELVVRPDPDIADLIPHFMSNRRKELHALAHFLESGSFTEICGIAHTWKGICRPYGFLYLESLSRELELAAKASDAVKVREVLQLISTHLDTVRVVFSRTHL